jgi:hypothetical protein
MKTHFTSKELAVPTVEIMKILKKFMKQYGVDPHVGEEDVLNISVTVLTFTIATLLGFAELTEKKYIDSFCKTFNKNLADIMATLNEEAKKSH